MLTLELSFWFEEKQQVGQQANLLPGEPGPFPWQDGDAGVSTELSMGDGVGAVLATAVLGFWS